MPGRAGEQSLPRPAIPRRCAGNGKRRFGDHRVDGRAGSVQHDLRPGTYDVVAVTTDGGGPPTAIPQTVVVHEGAYTSITLELDSGIR